MAFLGGLQGLGALAGGVGTGIGQGATLDNYLQNARAQGLAGNALSQAYTGQPAGGGGGLLAGLGNLFGGGQQASAAPAAAQPLSGLGAAGAGAQPIQQTPVPGADPGQPGVANSNLVGGGQSISPTSPFATQANQTPQPQPAQPQPDQSASQSTPAPFQTNASQGIGGQQTMTLPQFIQAARKVAPNASGRQIALAATELAKGGLLGYGAMTPYQSAQLALEAGLHDAQIDNIHSEIEKRKSDTANQEATQTRERDKEADTQADKSVTEAQSQLTEAKSAVDKNSDEQDHQRTTMRELVGQATSIGKRTDQMPAEWHNEYDEAGRRLAELQDEAKNRQTALKAAQDNLDKAKADREKQGRAAKAAKEYGRDTTSSQSDYGEMNGKTYHYKGSGDRGDMSNWEAVQ